MDSDDDNMFDIPDEPTSLLIVAKQHDHTYCKRVRPSTQLAQQHDHTYSSPSITQPSKGTRNTESEKKRKQIERTNQSDAKRSVLNSEKTTRRKNLSEAERAIINDSNRIRQASVREQLDEEQKHNIRSVDALGHRNTYNRIRNQEKLPLALDATVRPALHYIGKMDVKCIHCTSLHFAVERTRRDDSFNSCCNFGNVKVDLFQNYPEAIKKYFTSKDKEYIEFRKLTRSYNSALAMASMGAQLDILREGRGPYCFRIHGQVYHNAGPLHPENGEKPRYGQIYVLDTDSAAEERMRHRANKDCDENLMKELSAFISSKNPYAKSYYMMNEVEKNEAVKAASENRPTLPVRMIFDTTLPVDRRRYNVPVVNEVAVVYVGEEDDIPATRSLAVHSRKKGLEHIQSYNKICDPMIYPLFYPEGGEGWHPGLTKVNSTRKRTRISQREFYSYLLFTRNGTFNPLHHGGKLLQQYIVDAFVKIDQNRLNFDRQNQAKLRIDLYKGLQDFMHGDDGTSGPPGRRIVLPSSYKGGPRDMHQSYQDAMAIVAKYGKPDYFLTITCNPHWKEIVEQLLDGQCASDRPDIIARVFELKLHALMEQLLKDHVFGEVQAYVAVVEFQKRGLPHCHMLLIMKSGSKPRSSVDIDRAICAEIPDEETDKELYDIITSCMVHRLCGAFDPNSQCMVDGKCTKQYPKEFREDTEMSGDSYPKYRRRDDGRTFKSGNYQVDNRWIVPYNRYLSQKFGCHINLEVCALITAVKYLYKYVYKGSDRASLKIVRNTDGQDAEVVDEIAAHLNARYVCAPEAAHRIFGYDMQKRSDAVYRLQVHLPEENTVTFTEGNESAALESDNARKTNLTAFFAINKKSHEMFANGSLASTPDFVDSRNTLYIDMPHHYTFREHGWNPRKSGLRQLGRMYGVSPRDTERFSLRLLLLHRTGSTSYEDLRTVDGVTHPTFANAAKALNLLITDQYYEQCMDESDVCDKVAMSGVILGARIPSPGPRPALPQAEYNAEQCKLKGEQMYETLNQGQKKFVDAVLKALERRSNRLFFIDGPGGSGKTYVYTTLNYILRGRTLKLANVAWTGIAANLLPGGRTVNSTFKLSIHDGNKSSTMKRQTKEARNLKEMDCIIWDEVSMTPKCALEAVDALLQDIMQSSQPFGGKIVIIGGDFRQVLPIVNRGRQQDIVDAAVKSSNLWPKFETFTLSDNMRLTTGDPTWNHFLLEVGNGTNNGGIDHKVELPEDILSSGDLIEDIYGDVLSHFDSDMLTDRCILSSKNLDVNSINESVLKKLPGTGRCYLSIDEVQNDEKNSQHAEALNFPTEFLYSLTPTGMPPHELNLKEGAIIMLLRNLDVKNGLCNGTRLILKQLGNHVLGCHHACGDRKGQFVLIPRIDCYYDQNLPFRLRRRQFPIRLSFAMTIHKSQGQSFTKVGVDLTDNVFAHGQLYVALSRVTPSTRMYFSGKT